MVGPGVDGLVPEGVASPLILALVAVGRAVGAGADGELRLGRRGHIAAEIGVREEDGDRSLWEVVRMGAGSEFICLRHGGDNRMGGWGGGRLELLG